MKNVSLIIVISLCIIFLSCNITQVSISIVVPNDSGNIEKLAAKELQTYLSKIYPDYSFEISHDAPQDNQSILIGTVEHLDLPNTSLDSVPENPEGFLVTSFNMEDVETGVITSRSPAGLIYGVYQLLEKLGYGFYLSYEMEPEQYEHFTFDKWNFSDEPLVSERFVFNWHNFLSGCSGWNLEDWQQWITQSQKMGFNTVMVHAYGNNPMYTFTFNGKTKPVGYLTSSIKGRDWSTEHVNDVRRLPGGYVFDGSIFGSDAALVQDDQRIQAKQIMMNKAFQYAEERGVKVNFAMDFDILSTIPQDMIITLSETDRFVVQHKGIAWMGEKAGPVRLPRPDTEGGYQFYKAQVKELLDLYPQIDILTMWRRFSESVWVEMSENQMPAKWQKEYQEHISQKPESANYSQSAGSFAQSKVAEAFRKALNDLGREDIQLATGSWRFNNIASMAEFMPEEMSIIILDSEVVRKRDLIFERDTTLNLINQYVQPERMLPVIWAHHDDGAYIGSPLKYFEKFHNRLKRSGSGGFGIIHWMTRPFDLFFKNHIRQTWKGSVDESLFETCNHAAERCFGIQNQEIMSSYFQKWLNDMPNFGRETFTAFIDRKIKNSKVAIEQGRNRIELLNRANRKIMTEEQNSLLQYFIEYETFVIQLIQIQWKYEKFKSFIEACDILKARKIILSCYPDSVLNQYAKTIEQGEITRGEQGLLFSIGLRWLPFYISAKQSVGIDNICLNFGPTSHETLAQAPGNRTYFIDKNSNYWKTLGEKELGGKVITHEKSELLYEQKDHEKFSEIFQTGIEFDNATTITVKPFHSYGNPDYLLKGKYKLNLLLAEPFADSAGGRIFNVSIVVENVREEEIEGKVKTVSKLNPSVINDRIDIPNKTDQRNHTSVISYQVELIENGRVKLSLIPVKGKALICGFVLEPLF